MRWNHKEEQQTTTRRVQRGGPIRDKSYAYYKSQKHTPNSKPIEIKDAARTSRLRLLPSIIAIMVIVGSIFYSATLSVDPSVRMVRDQESIYRPIDEYRDYASEVLSSDLSSYTKFTADTLKIRLEILERFKELDAASISLPVLGRKPIITLSVRQPSLLLSSSTNLFVLDQNGFAVALARDVDSKYIQGLQNVKDESGLEINVGDQIVTSGTVGFIEAVNHQLVDKNLEISQLTLPQAANLLNINIKGLEYYVKMDISSDARLQSGRFIATKDELTRQGIVPSEYIDVRVEEKVFYK